MINSPAHLLITLIVAAIWAAPAVVVGYYKGRPVLGWVLGILAGWLRFAAAVKFTHAERRALLGEGAADGDRR